MHPCALRAHDFPHFSYFWCSKPHFITFFMVKTCTISAPSAPGGCLPYPPYPLPRGGGRVFAQNRPSGCLPLPPPSRGRPRLKNKPGGGRNPLKALRLPLLWLGAVSCLLPYLSVVNDHKPLHQPTFVAPCDRVRSPMH